MLFFERNCSEKKKKKEKKRKTSNICDPLGLVHAASRPSLPVDTNHFLEGAYFTDNTQL